MRVPIGLFYLLVLAQGESAAEPMSSPSVEPMHRSAPLTAEEASQLPARDLAARSFNQILDGVVAAQRQGGGLSAGLPLSNIDFLLQPTGAGIGGLCRSTRISVHFGPERGPGTSPSQPQIRSTPRRADDLTSTRVFKVAGPLHRLKTVEAQYAWDAACAVRRDVTSFMLTNLPDENALIPALIGIQHAIDRRHEELGPAADVIKLPPAWGGEMHLIRLENVASVRGIVDGDHIGALEVIFAPGGIDNGMGAKMTIHDVGWHWPAFDSPDYGVPSVKIGAVDVQSHEVIYD